ncbi:MAG: hypothetical protein ABIM31_04875 [candidate division WOR-3 bacterium]
MREETIKILKMVEEGKINAEEAYRLLEALGEIWNAPSKGKFVKIRIENEDGKVFNVSLPIGMIRFLRNIVPEDAKAVLNDNEIDLNEIINIIYEGETGTVLDVEGEDGESIKIWIE